MRGACAAAAALAPVHARVGCPGRYDRSGFVVAARQRVLEAAARADPELGEHLVQVPLDGPRAEVELGADLRIRPAVAREPGDVLLLWRELVAGRVEPPAHLRAGGLQLVPGALGERVGAQRDERLVRRAELLAGVDAAIGAPEPFAVEELAAGDLRPESRAPQAVDRLAVQGLGVVALRQQGARAGVEAACPPGVAAVACARRAGRAPMSRARCSPCGRRPRSAR